MDRKALLDLTTWALYVILWLFIVFVIVAFLYSAKPLITFLAVVSILAGIVIYKGGLVNWIRLFTGKKNTEE